MCLFVCLFVCLYSYIHYFPVPLRSMPQSLVQHFPVPTERSGTLLTMMETPLDHCNFSSNPHPHHVDCTLPPSLPHSLTHSLTHSLSPFHSVIPDLIYRGVCVSFHSIPFRSVSFHFIPFYSNVFHSILFHSNPVHSVLFVSFLFRSLIPDYIYRSLCVFHSISFHFITFLSVPFCSFK